MQRILVYMYVFVLSIVLEVRNCFAQPLVTNDGLTLTLQAGLTATIKGAYTSQTKSGVNGKIDNQGTIELTGDWTNNNSAALPNAFSTTAGAIIFKGAAYQQITGTALTDFNDITIDKGVDITSIVEAVAGGNGMSMQGQLILTNGMLKLTHASASAEFNASVTTSQSSGLWINGGSFCTSSAAGGNCLGSYSTTFNGLLRISSGSASFGNVSGNELEINNQGLVASYGILDMQGGTLNVAGRLFINNKGAMTMTAGDITTCTVGTSLANSGSFEVTATSSINMSGGTVFFQNPNTCVTVSDREDFLLSAGAGTKTFTGGTLQFGNASTPDATTFYCNDNSLGTPNVIISNATAGGTKPNLFLKSNLVVDGDMTIQAGTTLDVSKDGGTNNYDITMTGNATNPGNWTNNGTFTARDKTVTFNGTSAQAINGSTSTFNNLTINNTKAVDAITLAVATNVNGTLMLTDGHVITSTPNILTLGSSASTVLNAPGSQDSSFVKGPMIHTVDAVGPTTKVFPIGKNNQMHRTDLQVTHTDATSTLYTGEYINSSAVALGYTLPGTLDRVSSNGYWTISKGAGSVVTAANVTMSYFSSDDVTDAPNLRLAKDDGAGNWVDLGGVGSGTPSGTILSTNNFTSFSAFSLANDISGTNGLPIELLSFDATYIKDSNYIDINWTTATETNNDYFTIERSTDGKKFEEVTKVNGAGNSTTVLSYNTSDLQPLKGISYYRLKQTDFDRKTSYSHLVPVKVGGNILLTVFPNPSDGKNVTIQITSKETREVLVVVHDVMGREAFSKIVTTFRDGSFSIAFDPSQRLSPGIYLITASSDDEIFNQKLIIK